MCIYKKVSETCYILLHIVPSGAPQNFTVSVKKTTLIFEWDPPADGEAGGVITSYTLACTDENNDDFEIELNVIEKIAIDEFLPSTTYTCTILASTNAGDGPTASVTTTTEGRSLASEWMSYLLDMYFFPESTEIYLQFLDLDALLGVNEVVAARADDSYTGPISIGTSFPFGITNQTQFYVSCSKNDTFSLCNAHLNRTRLELMA